MDFLLKGIIIGFSIAAPVGPIGLLCTQRSILQGQKSGFMSGLGAATADAVYGSIAGFGIGLVSNFLVHQQTWIHLIGGVLLLLLGVKGLLTKPAINAAQSLHHSRGTGWNYLFTFLLTISNPMTIMSFVAVFAAIGVENSSHAYLSATLTVLGVFLGSAIWWLILSTVSGWIRGKFNQTILLWIGRLSGVIIVGFGAWGIASAHVFG